jgi:sulfur relay (sulfurtransferase) complex TusBCD TusD component (DsrE family)
VTRTSGSTLNLVLGTGPQEGATVAALKLAEAAIERGHRVTVYAYGEGVRTGAQGSPTGEFVSGLARRGVHGGRFGWVADRNAVGHCAASGQVSGVVEGDGGDLWRFILDADVALGVSA